MIRLLTAFGKAAGTVAAWLAGRRPGVAAILAWLLGGVTATAFAPFYFLPALLIGFFGLFWLLAGAQGAGRSRGGAFLIGWAFGFGYMLAGMYWLGFAFLVQADRFGWMIPIAVPGFLAFLGIFPGLAALAAQMLARRLPDRALTLAAMWVFFEFLRGHILTGLPWNLLSQSFAAHTVLLQPLAAIGPYGLSLLVLLMVLLPASAVGAPRAEARRRLGGALALLLAVLAYGGVRLALNPVQLDPAVQVAILQPNVAQRDKLDPQKRMPLFEELVRQTRAAVPSSGVTYAVWPENAHSYLAEDPTAPAFFAAALPAEAMLIAGTIRYYEEGGVGRYGNSVAFFDQTEDAAKPSRAPYDKHHLVPFGEYLPMRGLLTALGLSQLAPVQDGFTPGPGPQTRAMGPRAFAPLICFEDVFPLALYPKDNRPSWLVVVTNDAWFGDGAGPRQHLDIGRMRAVESGLPIVRSANTGVSALIGPAGQLLATVPLYTQGAITHALPQPMPKTLYDRFGNLSAILLLLGIVALANRGRLASRP